MRTRTRHHPATVRTLATVSLLLLFALVFAACGGSEDTAAPPVATTSPSAASAAEHLVGADSVETTHEVVDALGAGFEAQSGAQVATLYAEGVVYDDLTYDLHLEGKAAVLKELRRSMRQANGVRFLAGYAGSGWGVLEHRWDFTDAHDASIQPMTVFEIVDGKIVSEAWWYQDPVDLPDGTPPEPKPLSSAPGSQDTAASAETAALHYAAALQAKDADQMAALSAVDIAFMDTSAGTVAGSPDQVRTYYARVFEAPADPAFTDLRYVSGPGWATVIWSTGASEPTFGDGVTMLEIRDGKIARETLYYTSADVPFVAPATQ